MKTMLLKLSSIMKIYLFILFFLGFFLVTKKGYSQNTFTNNGINVGIGTTSPQAMLHVNNGNNSYGSILANSSETPFGLYTKSFGSSPYAEVFRLGLKYNLNENNGFISFFRGGSGSGGFLGLSTSGIERFRIDALGNVGVGTANPLARLTIQSSGTIGVGDLSKSSILLTDGTQTTGVDPNQIFSQQDFNIQAVTFLRFDTGGTERLRILENGKVGIGTTNPSEELEVNGDIKANKFKGEWNGANLNSLLNSSIPNIAYKDAVNSFTNNQIFNNNIQVEGNANLKGVLSFEYGSGGYIQLGMDQRTDFITNENGAYIYSGSGPTGNIPAGSLVLQSRSNADRDIVFVSGSIPSERLRIKGSGKVGIGTINPSEKLEVNGDVKANKFKGEWDGTNISNVLYKSGDATDWNVSVENGIYRKWGGPNSPFGTSHSTMLNVGQGNGVSYGFQLASNNLGKLKYRGFGAANSFDSWYEIYHSGNFNKTILDAAVPNIMYKDEVNTFTLNQTFENNLQVNGNVKLGSKIYWDWEGGRFIDMYSSDGSSKMIRFQNSMSSGTGNSDGGFDFQDNSGVSVLRIKDLKLGVGTNTPVAKLDVVGTLRATGKTFINSGAGIELRTLDNNSIGSVLAYDRDNSSYMPLRLEGSEISLREAGVDILNVQNGSIGIGTESPVSKLEVNGDIALARSHKIKFLETVGGEDRAYIRSTNGEVVGDFNSMIFAVGAGSESMIIKGDTRYVGIGTTNPSEKLDVAGNIKANEFRGNWDGANVSEVLFKGANSENWNTAVKNGIYRKKAGVNNPFGGGHSTLFNVGIHGGKNYGLQLATDNDKRLKYRGFKNNNTFNQWYDIYHSGNFNKTVLDAKVPNVTYKNVTNTFTSDQVFEGKIGIGVSNPDEKLHISSDTSGDAVLKIVSDTDNNNEGDNSRIELLQDGNQHGALIGFNLDWSNGGPSDSGNLFRIVTRAGGVNSVDNFVINPITKNVGIGTANPDSKLSVNGNIKSREVKVTVDDWSDFVFEKDYDLPTLKEVEDHIKEKGHLKDIPSAADVEKEGVYLGEINKKLLQKIEELTLYTIDQEKKLSSQEDKLSKQQKEILELKTMILKLSDKVSKQ